MSDCLICFCPIESTFISCGEPFCTARVCNECAPSLISFSEKEKVIPQCPSEKCKGYYMLKDIRNVLSKDSLTSYYNACLQAIIKSKGELAKKANEQQDILIRLRKEREHFLKANFPAAISTVAMVAFPSKLRRIEKQRAEFVSEQLNASNKLCMNLSCNGHLDKDMVCMVCETEFCKKCEEILEEGHECKEEEVESIGFIGEMVKCPKCGLAIQKSEGCNNMTCTICGEHFIYDTGEKGGYGAHGNQKTIIHEKSRFSSVYSDTISDKKLLTLLLEFESKKPKISSEKIIINSLQKMYRKDTTGDKGNATQEVTRRFNIYMRKRYAMKRYQKVATSVEKALRKKEATVSFLREAIDSIV